MEVAGTDFGGLDYSNAEAALYVDAPTSYLDTTP